MDAAERAGIVHDACARAWHDNADATLAVPLGDRRLVLQRRPDLIRDSEDRIVGVDAWVRLYEADGREVRIDPHRRIICPPTVHHEHGGDPYAAWLQVVKDSVAGTPARRNWRKDGTGGASGTVDTFFSATTDGRIEGNSATYANAREGTGTINVTTADTSRFCGQFLSATYSCYELFFSFDTSAITDTDIVTSVTLDLWLVTDSHATTWDLEARTFDWGASLTSADYVPGSQLGSKTLLSSRDVTGLGATGAYKTWASSANFVTATNIKTGTVYVMLSSSAQRLNVAPTTTDGMTFSMADNTGTTQDPKLTVTHNVPASSPFFTGQPLRVHRKART
ncbi:hypothetical protein J5X84_36095 [Streptosporangiaceae bacterium NEAU-GS5]|nr:hypothetical protein [Streptosporangiaceae bacterium NEAU-GS5]